ncbi:hypothetical protein QYF36_008309 [Acer negundo]|nr:hypothetical protein QYF36_008309 [Acer negundo]
MSKESGLDYGIESDVDGIIVGKNPVPPILLASAAIWIQIRDSLYLLVKQLDFVDLGFRISDCGSIDHDLERFRVHSCKGLSEFGRFRRVMLLWK